MTPDSLLAEGRIAALDREFARFLERHYRAGPAVQLAGCLASAALRGGHAWIELDGPEWPSGLELEDSPAIGAADGTAARRPLVRDGMRLGLHRAWSTESRLAAVLARLAAAAPAHSLSVLPERVRAVVASIFGGEPAGPDGDLQAAAAFLPLASRLAVISGGPGTGKTTSLTRLLALQAALAVERGSPPPRVLLCAPTGKAAARMAESLAQGCAALPPELATPILSARPRTIHRLLGLGGPLSKPAFGAGRPLEGDLVVVDESSMVDLDLMAALLEALPPEACLVLLGDRCQLPSVEAGRILADLCAHFPANAFSDGFAALVNSVLAQPERHVTGGAARSSPVVELRHSWRFRGDEAIGLVSRAVNSGDPALALETVRTTSARAAAGGSVCTLEPLPGAADLSAMVHEGWQGLLQAKTPGEALERLTDFMCLTATNEGPHGRNGINRAMEGRLASSRVRPVIITENSPRDNLYNGYLGVLFREGQRTLAWFTVDGHPAPFLPAFLPAHDEAWAITVHKSQGSEFGRVLFLLPEPPEGSLAQANRELLYTGITRAKRECRILGSGSTFADAAANATSRRSGLAARLAALEGIRTSGR